MKGWYAIKPKQPKPNSRLYENELDNDTVNATKNLCCAKKGEDEVDHSALTRWILKSCTGCKNLDNQARSGRPKTADSETVLKAIEASGTRRVSGELKNRQS